MKNCLVYSIIWGIVLLFVCVGYPAIAVAQNDPLANLEIRIEKLEQRLELKQELDGVAKELREQKFENIEQQYAQTIQQLRNEQQAYKNEVQEKNLLIYVTWAFIGVIGLGTFVQLRRWTKDEVSRQVADVLKTESDLIKQIIDAQALENRLKKEKRLLVISGSDTKMKEIEKEFEAMKFERATSRLLHTIVDLDRNIFKPDFHEELYDFTTLSCLINSQRMKSINTWTKANIISFLGFHTNSSKILRNGRS